MTTPAPTSWDDPTPNGAGLATSGLLDADHMAYLRSELGTELNVPDLQSRFNRLHDIRSVAAEVVKERLATVLTGPSSFSIPGVYSESTNEAKVKALSDQVVRIQSDIDATAAVAAGFTGTGRVVRTDRVR